MTLEHHSEKASYDYLLSSPACTTAEPFDNPAGIWAVMDENDAALLASCDEVRAAYGYTRYTVYILDSSLTDGLPFKKLKETFYTSEEVLHELLTQGADTAKVMSFSPHRSYNAAPGCLRFFAKRQI